MTGPAVRVAAWSQPDVSRRTERVASLIRAVLAEAVQHRLNDPRIAALTSITRVDVSADLSTAHVYVSVVGQAAKRELSLIALRHAAGRLRAIVAERVALRQTPQLNFRLDDSIRGSFETVQEIDRIMEELGECGPAGETPGTGSAGASESAQRGGGPGGAAAGKPMPEMGSRPDGGDRATHEGRRTPKR